MLCVFAGASADPVELRKRWVYCEANLTQPEGVARLLDLMSRAAHAGYNGLVIPDRGFVREDPREAIYRRNAARIREDARRLGLEIVPAIFPIGDSRPLLRNDPNLAEGLPVRDALYVVRDGVARLEPDPPVRLRGGDFTDLSQWDGHDRNVAAEDGTVHVLAAGGTGGRIYQRLRVRPFRQYHVRVLVKTQELSGTPQIVAMGGRQALNYNDLGREPTREWTEGHAVFNSLDHDEITLYFVCSKCSSGSLWWRDARIQEVGLLNAVRRDGAPLVVRLEGGRELREGKDFEHVADPRMGTAPSPGSYEIWHEPPSIRTKGLPTGTRLRVSYYHAVVFGRSKVMICPSEPKTIELLREQARRAHELWGAKTYFMSHDEIRILDWDVSCSRRRLTPGQIVADNVRTCRRILRQVSPHAEVYVWSDMFDPHHNAHAGYYLVNGDLAGAWEGLDRDVVVALWNFSERDSSLSWFARRSQPMLIAGYYDAAPELVSSWLDSARGVSGVVGVMYTTWQQRYDDLERFALILKEARR